MKYIFAYVLHRYAITYIHTYTYKFLGQKVQSQFVGLVPCRVLAYTLLGVPLSPCTASRQILVESERCSSSLGFPTDLILYRLRNQAWCIRAVVVPARLHVLKSFPSRFYYATFSPLFSFTTKEAEIPHL